eukprot:m.95506 g.95506  ORF g.95506 m.95506 type:complete len:527 (-) comp14770_c0_seq1:199-1779(-)
MTSWAENGSLYDYLYVNNQQNSKLRLEDKLRILTEVCSAMEFLHAKNIVHRDLKSPNILLDGTLSAKVCDFDLGAIREEDSKVTHAMGTPLWASPEQLLDQEDASLRWDTDVFSFGCVMWEVLFECKPWHHLKSPPTSYNAIELLRTKYKQNIYLPVADEIHNIRLNDEQRDLLKRCFQPSGRRIQFSQLYAALAVQTAVAKKEAEFDAEQYNLMLHGSPNAAWKYSAETLAQFQNSFRSLTARPSVKLAFLDLKSPDHVRLVKQMLHEAGGRTANEQDVRPFGYDLVAAGITTCDVKNVTFHGCYQRNLTRYRGKEKDPTHLFKSRHDPNNAEETAVLDHVTTAGHYRMLGEDPAAGSPFIRIQRVFHGVHTFSAVTGILSGDFAQLQIVDSGWYGSGFYFTPDLDYALGYAFPCSAQPDTLPAELQGSQIHLGTSYQIVLVCDVQYGNPYPMLQRVRSTDGVPLKGGHDAHVAVSDFTSGDIQQAEPFASCAEWRQNGKKPVAEIVVNDPSCVVVRGFLVFKAK